MQVRKAIIKVPDHAQLGEVAGGLMSHGDPVVGLMAVNEEEMDFLAENMTVAPNTAEDVLRIAHGSNYYDPNAVRGLAAGAQPSIQGRGGKKTKKFR